MKKSLFILVLAAILASPTNVQAKENSLVSEPISVQNNYYDSIEYLSEDFKTPIKAIFTDIENVLAIKSYSIYSIPENTKTMVQKLKEQNLPLILMTDKSTAHAKNVAEQMGIRDSYIIGNNGAIIVDEYDEVLYVNGINKKDLEKILTDVKSFNKYYRTKSKGFFYANKKLYAFKDVKFPYISDTHVVIKNTKDLPDDTVTTQISFYEPNAKTLRSLKRYLTKRYGDNFNISTSENCYLNIVSKSVSKANALIKLSEKFGYKLSDLAVFGYNEDATDYMRLIKVNGGLPLTFKSAPAKVKEASDYAINASNYKGFSVGAKAILDNNEKIKDAAAEIIEF